jgi:hypothetical protein
MNPLIKTGAVPMLSKAALQNRRKQLIAGGYSITYAQLKAEAKIDAGAEIYRNDVYQVIVKDAHEANMALNEAAPPAWYLSIKRIDQEPICSWRDIQEIKNQLVGPDHEGIMLYPSEKRVMDTANQYHLFILKDVEQLIPYGFNCGRHVVDETPLDRAKQTARR